MSQLPDDLSTAGWSLSQDGKGIEKTFKFKDFRSAMAWMVRAAFEAEAMDHHPEWSNVYNRVSVRLTTHDIDGLGPKDLELAARLERLGA